MNCSHVVFAPNPQPRAGNVEYPKQRKPTRIQDKRKRISMNPKELIFTFTITRIDAKLIDAAIVKLPFEMADTIHRIREALSAATDGHDGLTFTINGSDAELMGLALAKLPYEQVVNLMNRLQASINVQLAKAQESEQQAEAAPIDVAAVEAKKLGSVAVGADRKSGRMRGKRVA
jgi:hypothetical protein